MVDWSLYKIVNMVVARERQETHREQKKKSSSNQHSDLQSGLVRVVSHYVT